MTARRQGSKLHVGAALEGGGPGATDKSDASASSGAASTWIDGVLRNPDFDVRIPDQTFKWEKMANLS